MSDKGIPSMSEIYQLGHVKVADIFSDPVSIEEKIDGSFISFAVIDGELVMRSKGQQLFHDAPSSQMFKTGMVEIENRKTDLTPGFVYRGEYLAKPKHNTLAYERVPNGHIVLFDIERAPHTGDHLSIEERALEADRLGFDSVPVLFFGKFKGSGDDITKFLEVDSYLGGQKIEGVVIKSYSLYDHGRLQCKFVSSAFKEKHATAWKNSNPSRGDVIEMLIETYRTEARWRKAIQHLKENGQLEGSPRDIGALMKEIPTDILKEEEDAIKAELWKYVWPKISRGVTRGFPDFYKEMLLAQQFEEDE